MQSDPHHWALNLKQTASLGAIPGRLDLSTNMGEAVSIVARIEKGVAMLEAVSGIPAASLPLSRRWSCPLPTPPTRLLKKGSAEPQLCLTFRFTLN